ncbi:hypothetical protein HanPI659440_Chr04g0157321 [Helianthus annuus]|nr:hypothetical protein HanPI659440_Chr04g0157321 [Helianthus annuus]
MELVRLTFPWVLTEITTVVGVSLGTSIWVWFTQSTFGSGSDLRIRLIQDYLGFGSRGFSVGSNELDL